MPKPPGITQVKVTLLDIRPPIWRRLQVPSDITLEGLHYAIQDAFGWTNSHLHQFTIGVNHFGMYDAQEDPDILDERKHRLGDLVGEKDRFVYEYDFGDDWEHLVVVEKVLPKTTRLLHPVCLGGKRACPPEDCGGPGGYADLVAALADPRHERHREILDWIGDFDPEWFVLDDANEYLRTSRTRRLTERFG